MAVADSERRFLALGDSYTIGEDVTESMRWPAQLTARLRERGVELVDPDIVATTGWTSDELLQAIDAREFDPPYAMVSLLIGVNNQYRGRDLDNYREEFSALLDFAVRIAAGKPAAVMVISIPDWATTAFARAQGIDAVKVAGEIDAFNAAARAICRDRGSHWIDVTEISRDAGRQLLASDGLHPSAAQYSLWVDVIEPVAHSIIASRLG
ncbi:MAG TPA: SGNH/GDSL hydrolase family protein [Dokdonella sp.]|uniref:SGNH/GDSL hydrolase family protein n=1 Tax=Dokdonella sp. TaxID=2291710 RepID=UPI002D7F415B|nr:SGNH/GDSL hydrolase family protein [Dokdonella sp.]HET9031660.1 SGNH/GDSL hydrolase family protein [Dokdonella sp.]